MLRSRSSLPKRRTPTTTRRTFYEEARALIEGKGEGVTNPLDAEFKELGRYTTEDILAFFKKHLGSAPSYTAKNPNVTIEELTKKFEAQFARPVPGLDDKYYKWVGSLGYTRTEADEIIKGLIPQLEKNGTFDWDVISRYFSQTDSDARQWKEISELYKSFSELKPIENPVNIDWAEIEKELGAEYVQVNKTAMENFIASVPKVDASAIAKEINAHLAPMIERLKDEVYEDLPKLESITDEIVRNSELPGDVASGMMHINDFLDKYAPEVRNQMLQEVEEEHFDYEYKDEIKEFNMTIEDYAFTKDKIRELYTEAAAAGGETSAVSMSATDLKLKELAEQQARIKSLEADLQRLKSKEETDDKVEDESAKKKKEEDPRDLDLIAFGREHLSKHYPAFADALAKAQKKSSGGKKDEAEA